MMLVEDRTVPTRSGFCSEEEMVALPTLKPAPQTMRDYEKAAASSLVDGVSGRGPKNCRGPLGSPISSISKEAPVLSAIPISDQIPPPIWPLPFGIKAKPGSLAALCSKSNIPSGGSTTVRKHEPAWTYGTRWWRPCEQLMCDFLERTDPGGRVDGRKREFIDWAAC